MNIDKLKQVIQAANPEIMELKFGCEVIVNNKIQTIGSFEEMSQGLRLSSGNLTSERMLRRGSKILGRPIRLSDVLVAIRKHDEKQVYAVDSMGNFIFFCGHDMPWRFCDLHNAKWDLQNDNLDHQSGECKKFLCDLLT